MLVVLLLCFILINYAKTDPVLVQIRTGQIEGLSILNQISGQTYFSFQGIPYAQAPIGQLRFQAPKEPKKWTGTLETKTESPICYQYPMGFEDCLYLNVFTPLLPKDNVTEMPVIFFIHGGAFVFGSSSWATPEYLLENNVVLVTIHYRLNVFGFLNTDANSDNVGLRDQIAALHWVQKNIKVFNGDPNKVTIMGHSAGAASVLYLMQTKLTKGLFHGAIALSGSSLNQWSVQRNPKERAFKLGFALGLKTDNATELIQFLLNKTAAEVFNASVNQTVMGINRPFKPQSFVPSPEFESAEALFTESSYDSLILNNIHSIPFMTGYVSDEGLFFKKIANDLNIYKNNIELLVPTALNCSADKLKLAAAEIEEYFFKNDSVTDLHTFLTYQGQQYFIRGVTKTVELMKRNNKIYFYKFSFNNNCESCAVVHTDELKYIFKTNETETYTGYRIRKQMTKLLTNFVKTGNPTPVDEQLLNNIRWPAVTKEGTTKYLHISNNNLSVEENSDQMIFDFWESLFVKYGNPPFYTW